MPRLRAEDIPRGIAPAVQRTEPREGEVLLTCPRGDCDWQTVRPNEDRVVWSALEAHRIRHEKGTL